jgi:hypothetical protein
MIHVKYMVLEEKEGFVSSYYFVLNELLVLEFLIDLSPVTRTRRICMDGTRLHIKNNIERGNLPGSLVTQDYWKNLRSDLNMAKNDCQMRHHRTRVDEYFQFGTSS